MTCAFRSFRPLLRGYRTGRSIAAAGQPPDPAWGRVALYASRTNFILSFPMLLFMGGGSHGAMDWPMILVSGLITAAVGAVVLFSVQKWYAAKF